MPPVIDPSIDEKKPLLYGGRLLRYCVAHVLVVRSYVVHAAVCVLTQSPRREVEYCEFLQEDDIHRAVEVENPTVLVAGS